MTWGASFRVHPVPSSSADKASGARPFYARMNQPARPAAPSGFVYIIYENVIKIKAAIISTVLYLAISMRAWVEPERVGL